MTQALAADPAISARPPRHLPDRPPMLAVGVIIWLGSEVMFFSSLFAAFFTIRAHAAVWPPRAPTSTPSGRGMFTVILVASSFTMQKAVWDQERGERKSAKIWVWITFVIGPLFVANQFFEWVTLSHDPATNPTQTAYGSLFYIMSGTARTPRHPGPGGHALPPEPPAGPGGDPGETAVFQGVSYYWHFVDVVWVGLYGCLFLLK